jgi:hypothetical protein
MPSGAPTGRPPVSSSAPRRRAVCALSAAPGRGRSLTLQMWARLQTYPELTAARSSTRSPPRSTLRPSSSEIFHPGQHVPVNFAEIRLSWYKRFILVLG